MTPSPRGAAATTPEIDWNAVLSQYDRWLRTVVYARLRDAEATDEVMQELALAAVRQAAPLDDPDKVAPWLYRLAVRGVLLWRRQQGRQRKLVDRFAARQPAGDGQAAATDPLAWLLAGERRALVRAALERLPARDLEMLLLKYTEDWTYHEIARHLGVSHSVVQSRLHRARRRLRRELAAVDLVEASR